jgi:hypothetical protein
MSGNISERDWKIFRELRQIALERLCNQILTEAKAEIERPPKSSHEKYLSLYQLMEKRDDDVARAFNDFRRSTAIMQIGIIHSMGLFTPEELHRFSTETLQIVEIFAGAPIV